MPVSRVNPCNPGRGASCALCCGSHNYRAPFREIDGLFNVRRARIGETGAAGILSRIRNSRSDLTGSYYFRNDAGDFPDVFAPLVPGGVQCSYVGYIDGSRIGCLVRDSETDGPNRDCPYHYYGKQYTCDSFRELSDEDVLFAALLAGDWYYYGLLIHSFDLLRSVKARYASPEMIGPGERGDLFSVLDRAVGENESFHRIDGYFT